MSKNVADEKMQRLHPTQLDHLTMEVTVDVSDLAAPQVLYLMENADGFETDFEEIVVGMRGKQTPAGE